MLGAHMFPYPWWLIGWLPNDHNQQTTTCAIRRARAAGSGGNQLKDVREARQWPAMGMTALFPALSHLPGPGAGPPQDALCPAAHHRGAHRGRSTARRVLLESGPPFGVTAACARQAMPSLIKVAARAAAGACAAAAPPAVPGHVPNRFPLLTRFNTGRHLLGRCHVRADVLAQPFLPCRCFRRAG